MAQWINAADPSRVHTEGRMARAALEEGRDQVASLFGTRPRQVIFTSGATEAVNAAVYDEHITWVGVDREGRVDPAEVTDAIGSETVLVHCQWANHEVGTLQPVAEIVAVCRARGILVHVDAAAAAGHVAIGFDDLGAGLLSVSAHKMGGPRGAGALLVRRGLRVPPLLVGGAQERARRGGMENVPALVGFGAAAATLADGSRLAAEAQRARAFADRLRAAAGAVGGVELYGPAAPSERLPGLVCAGIEGVEAEGVLLGLDQAGVAAHSGSACSTETLEPSPVLAAMGVDAERSLRLSVGWSTTDADVDLAVAVLAPVIDRLRALAGPPPA
jgi:cysteine desulfurase